MNDEGMVKSFKKHFNVTFILQKETTINPWEIKVPRIEDISNNVFMNELA